ncbi:MAG TPA: Ig-like domain-containing protein [Allosphingosinicella sp.]
MSDPAPFPTHFRPPLFRFRGEMVMADIAYRTSRLRRNMSTSSFQGVLNDRSNGGIPIPAAGFDYSAAEISNNYRVVASTGDDFIRNSALGTDGSGGTRAGLQAVILQERSTGRFFLSVAGVWPFMDEFFQTANSVSRYGFRYEWSRDLVEFMRIAASVENISQFQFYQTYGHSGALSTIFGADVYLTQNSFYRAFGQVVSFQGFAPRLSVPDTDKETLNVYSGSEQIAAALRDKRRDEMSPEWYNVVETLPRYFGLHTMFDNMYVDIGIGADLVSEIGGEGFGAPLRYRYGAPSTLGNVPLIGPLYATGSDHLLTSTWQAADRPGNNEPIPSLSGWVHQDWFSHINLQIRQPRLREVLPIIEDGWHIGSKTYRVTPQGLVLESSFKFILKRDSQNRVVLRDGLPLLTGDLSLQNKLSVARTYEDPVTAADGPGVIRDLDILIPGNPFGLTFSDLGAALGSELGSLIGGKNKLVGVLASGTLQTVGDALGDILDGVISGGSFKASANLAFMHFTRNLGRNILGAGVGAVSSFLTAELSKALNLSGFGGELFNSAAGSVINTILSNMAGLNGAAGLANPLSGAGSMATLGSAVGAFLGAKLASTLVKFDSVGGQLGSAIGTSLGVLAAGKLLSIGGLLGGPLGAAIGAFAGYLIGGFIGSLFGGTPRSGADVQWDEAKNEFVVANVYSRKGGSKDAARNIATAVAETFNGLLETVGGTLLNGEAVQAGNYGMRSKTFVYRPTSTRDKDAITRRFSGKDGAERLISYGIYEGLTDPDFKIAGGDVYAKRALYNTFAGGIDEASFDASIVFGNVATAQQYRTFLENGATLSALIAAEPHGTLAAETAIMLARAVELGLTKRHESDWYGGFSLLFSEAGTNAANVGFSMNYDPVTKTMSREIYVGSFVVGDSIDTAAQTLIQGGDAAETITLTHEPRSVGRGDNLVDAAGWPADTQNLPAGAATLAGWRNLYAAETRWAAVEGPDGRTVTAIESGQLDGNAQGGGGDTNGFSIDGSKAYEFSVFFRKDDVANRAISFAIRGASGGAMVVNADGGSDAETRFVELSAAQLESLVDGRWYKLVGYVLPEYSSPVAAGSLGGVFDTLSGEKVANAAAFRWNPGRSGNVAHAAFYGHGGTDAPGYGTYFYQPEAREIVETMVIGGADRLASTAGLRINGVQGDGSALSIPVSATINAGAGDDVVHAGDMGNNAYGAEGNDTLYGGRLDDWLLGGDGNDVIHAGSQAGGLGGDGNYLDGGAGNDQIVGREGSDWIEGGDGTDVLDGGGGGDILAGGAGDGDDLKGGHGDDEYLVRRGDGSDEANEVASGAPVVAGMVGDAVRNRFILLSQPGNAHLRNWIGDGFEIERAEVIRQASGTTAPGAVAAVDADGEDSIVFAEGIGMGDVRLFRPKDANGNDLPDLIVQVMTTDPLSGVESFSGTQLRVRDWFTNPFKRVEWLKFADGNEIRIADVETFIVGTNGDDILNGTNGRDFVYGGGGNDHIRLYAGDDIGSGGSGDDAVWGDEDRDLLIGGVGSDKLYGGTQDDSLSGDAGNDELMGEDGADVLSGGRGDDLLVGGAGADTFKFSRGDGRDLIVSEPAAAAADAGNDANWQTIWQGDWIGEFDREWLGWDNTFRWRGTGATRRLEMYVGAVTSVFAASDIIEFDIGIDIQDVVLVREGANLVLVVSDADAEFTSAATAADRITIQNWYNSADPAAWGSSTPVGRFAFYQTGILEAANEGWSLVAGGEGADTISAAGLGVSSSKFWITGGGGDDVVEGGAGDDILHGNGGSDELRGGGGKDVLYAGAGNNVLIGGAGADTLVGGFGTDTASYAGSGGVKASLSDPSKNTGDAAGDVYSSIENLTGGDGADDLEGHAGENAIHGGRGSDYLRGRLGADTYMWNSGDGADVIFEGFEEAIDANGSLGGLYAESWSYTSHWIDDPNDDGETPPQLEPEIGNEPQGGHWEYRWSLTITGPGEELVYQKFNGWTTTSANDQPALSALPVDGWRGGFVPTGNGAQVSRGDSGGEADLDVLELGAGISLADLAFAWSGDDLVITVGGDAASRITIRNQRRGNGNGVETILFADGGSVSLANVLATTPGAPNAAGSTTAAVADLISGDDGSNALSGHGGSDALSGRGGNDWLYGGEGDDVLEGGAGADHLDGGAHSAAAADPTGWGDTARYATSASAVSIDLTAGSGAGGDAQGDSLSGIEHVVGSNATGATTWGNAGDRLTGNDADNRLFGLAGDDRLSGGAGKDVLVGGDGADQLYGDAGDDNLEGGEGADLLYGGGGKDFLGGGGGNDRLEAGADSTGSTLEGGDGDDQLYGAGGIETMYGGAGADLLSAADGADSLDGGEGSDTLYGGGGDDSLTGGAGGDTMAGGAGADVYKFDANSGADTITDSEGRNRILFTGVGRDQLWLTKSGNDLHIRVLGGSSHVTVLGYFAGAASAIRDIAVGTDSIFLNQAAIGSDANSLVSRMSSVVPIPASAADVPPAIATARDALWVTGGMSRPMVVDQSFALDERSEPEVNRSIAGQVGAVDPDENVTGPSSYSVSGAPQLGTVTLSATTAGAWTYVPTLYANGTDTFRIKVVDADGNSAEQTVTINIAPVDSKPVFAATQPSLSILETATGGTQIGTIAVSDPDGTAPALSIAEANSPFQISAAGLLSVKAGATFNSQSTPTINVTVQASDNVTPTVSRQFSVTIVNVNDPPGTPTVNGTAVTFAPEGALGGTTIANFSLPDPDGDATSLRIRTGSTSIFAASGSTLRFAAGFNPNFETIAAGATLVDRDLDGQKEVEYSVAVESWDGQVASTAARTMVVGIEDVNEAPTSIILTGAATAAERDRPATGAALPALSLGTLSAADPDVYFGETFVFTPNDSRFEVVNGNELRLKAGVALDYESALVDGSNRRYLDLSVTARDHGGTGLSVTQNVRIFISDSVDHIYGTAAAETLSGTAGRDALYGRDGNDVLQGLQGDDELYGEGGTDMLQGGDGNDLLDGRLGADTLQGGLGDDVYVVDDGADSVVEQAGQGTDEVRTSLVSHTLAANVEKLTGTLATGQTLRGNVHDNILAGGAGGDTFHLQDAGLDKVSGGGGNDVVYFGGTHSAGDEFDGGAGTDTVLYQGNTNISAADMRLFNVESISLLAGSNSGWGDNFNNRYSYSFTATDATAAAGVQLKVNGSSLLAGENLTFNGAADTDSSFYIYGGMGVDTFTGGAGNDIFYFDKDGRWAAGDTVVGGAGTADEIILRGAYSLAFGAGSFAGVEKLTILNGTGWGTQFSYNLSTNQTNVAAGQTLTVNASNLLAAETLTFSGAAETDGYFHITGGAGNDVLTGGALADTIVGGAGNDTLTGGTGADRLEGGTGDDIYFVDDAGDAVVELAGQGSDEVRTSLAEYRLADNVEKLTGTLAGTQSFYGNVLDNVVTGNIARDWFYMQQGGADHVIGNAGSDLFFFGNTLDAADRVDGGADTDAIFIQGNITLNTSILTLSSIDQFTVLSGTDARYGEAGTSIYNYSLTTGDGSFTGGGRVAISAGGLVAGESITFNGAAETDVWYYFVAGQGLDKATGGAGNDLFYFDKDDRWTTGDTVVGGAGTDEIVLRGAYNIAFGAGSFSGVEKMTITTGAAWATQFSYNVSTHQSNVAAGQNLVVDASSLLAGERVTFNGSAETDGSFTITGGADADTLTGGALADTILGGAGNDTLTGGAGADRLEGGLGDDVFVVDSTADTVVELAGQGGADEVQTALVDYTLAAEVEKLTGTAATGQTLRGNTLHNIVKGGSGNDAIHLDAGGNDTADGGAGDDVFVFGATFGASDTIVGGAGVDSIILEGSYNVTLGATTLSGVDSFSLRTNANAASFNSYALTLNNANIAAATYLVVDSSLLRAGETVNVNAAAELDGQLVIIGGASTETATGGAYNDVFYFTQGMLGASDVMVGGAGWDALYFAGGVTATLGATTISGVEAIAFVAGTAGTAYHITAHDSNTAAGTTMNVYADALTAGETLTFVGSAETNGTFWMTGGASKDTFIGGAGADTMKSAAGDDKLRGGAGNDRLEGGDGKDELEGGAGADQLVGGNDTDLVSYAGSAQVAATLTESVGAISQGVYTKAATSVSYTGVRVDLVANSSIDAVNFTGATGAIGGDAEGDRFSGIENLTGSAYNDRLRGTAAASEVRGGLGNDVIYGGDGDDNLYGDENDDVIYGQEGRDTLDGGAGNDRLFGEGLGDTLYGGTGDDDLIGGAGQDIYRFETAFGNDTVYNYDGDGSPDVMEFASGIANTDLWFSKSGKDLVIKQLGTTNQVTVKGYFLNDVAGNWDDNGDFVVNTIIAGIWSSNYKVNTPALLSLMNGAPPASFASLTAEKQNQIKAAWGVNTKPTITAFASNPVSTGEGVFIDLKFTIADGQSPAQSLKLTYSVTSGIFQPIQATDWSYDPTDDRVRTLRLRPVVDSHGLATLTLSANDWVFDSDTFTTQVRLLARGDPVLVSAPLTKSTNVGTTVLLPGSLAGGDLFKISDTNSEIFNHVKVEAVPVGATLSDGVNSFTATAGATTATITNWNLAALRVTPAAGSTTDFTMILKAASKENLQPHEIVPGEQVGPEGSTTIKVIVNAAPTSVGLRGTGLAATPSVNEFTPTTNPAGAVVGVAVASDPDSIEANRVSTDFNLLPRAGGGEERIITAAGPTGAQVQVLETGQFAGMGGDAGHAGGGVYGASAGAPDTTRAYKYTIYVKPENLITHYLYLGAIGQVENATTGAADGNPYFYYGLSTSLTQNRWYRIEGWVLPAGHAPVAGDVFGGVFDTVTGAKVANTTTFRFAPGATDTGVRFFSYYGQEATGYSAQWYQPQVEKLDFNYSLIDNGGGRFAVNSVTGLVTAVGTNFNYEAVTSHNLTVRATDSTGLIKDQVINVAVNNINERPNPITLQSQTLYSEYVTSADLAHPGQSIARFNMSDPDGTTPELRILSAQAYPWFRTSGNQLLFDQANFSAAWLRGSLGAYGQDAGYYYDTDGDGLKEIRVATLTLAAADTGGLVGDSFTYNVLIEDRNEAPAFATQTLSLPENPGSYQLIGTAIGSDIDGPTSDLRYTFNGAATYYDAALGRTVSASSDGRFVLDHVDGRVWTKGAQALNYEGTNAFAYTVQVFDRANGAHKLSATGTLNINLTNVNEAPGPMTLASQTLHSETLPGDTPHYSAGAIATFGLSDPDGTTPAISIIGGNGNGWFGTSGNQLIFSTANFSASWLRSYAGQYGTDATWSYDTDNDGLKEIRVATLTLAATDSGGLQGTPFTYNVLIEDKNETPLFAANPYSFSIAENAAAYQYVGAVAGSDVDGPAGELRYTFAGRQWYVDGNLGRWVTSSADGRFLMDFHDGRVWKTSAALDYESTPALSYQISVYDRALGNNTKWSNATLNIGVQNVNDNAPAMPTVDQWGTTAFNENSGSSMAIAYLSVPYDPDGSAGLSYQITSNPDNLFEISGWAIRMKADRTPNYETFASGGASTTIQVRVRVTDGTYASPENAINVTIYNVNDTGPSFTQTPGTFTVAENTAYGTVVSDGVRAVDSDGGSITYSIDPASNPNGAFGINAYGQITIANGVDYEAANWLADASGKYANLLVRASDGGGTIQTTVQARITNQVLRVVEANGALTSRYRFEQTSTSMGQLQGPPYYEPSYYDDPPYGGEYGWYTEVRYVDTVTGAVVMIDGATGPYAYTTNRPLPDPNYWQLAEGFRRTGNGYELISDDEHNSWSLAPIVLDLLGTGLDNAFGTVNAAFDVDGDGKSERLRWLNPGFAFLALDRNGDGRIGSGLEISFVQDKAGAKTDLEGLAAYDSNGDGTLSAGDVRFADFLVWQDLNGDAVSQASELKTLTQTGISAIGLTGTPTGRTLANTDGHVTVATGQFAFGGGTGGAFGDTILRPTLADASGDEADGIAFDARRFARKAGKYRLSVDGGTLSIVPLKPKGVLDPRAGAMGAASMLSFRNRRIGMLAPVVLDLDGDGIELVRSSKARARFDMDGDGRADDTGWIGKGDGLLVIDRNGDGRISGPGELSFLAEKAGAKSDLDALSALDSNRDGKLDSADARFAELKVWEDRNGNGVTEEGELRALSDRGIAAIGLAGASARQTAKLGDNIVLSTGTFTRTDGSTGTLADAALAFRPGARGPADGVTAQGASDALELRLEALRAALDSPMRLDALDFEDQSELAAKGTDAQAIAAGPAELLDRRTALMTQHMAAFGAAAGEAEWRLREQPRAAHFDYFA